jgi:hypothetical protein
MAVPARGSQPEKLILLVAPTTAADAQRVRLELVSLGFVVADVVAFDPEEPLPEGVVAAVDLAADGRKAHLWIAGGNNGRALHRGTVFAPQGEQTLPVRVAEDLRALLERRDEPPTPPPASACPEPTCPEPTCPALRCPPPVVCFPVIEPDPNHDWAGGLDAAVLMPSNGVGAGGHVFLELQRVLGDRFQAGVLFAWPIVAANIDEDGSRSKVNATIVGLRAHARLLPDAEAKWNARATVGVALQWLKMDGRADPPKTGQHDEVWSSLSFVGIAVLHSLSEESFLRAGLSVGTSTPPVTIRFAEQPTADWGAPLVWASLGFETALF